MNILKELSKIITRRKVAKIEIIDSTVLNSKKSKFHSLYEGLISDKFEDDNDAALYIYGSSPTDPRYRQLKSRFKKRMLNTLFFLDVNQPVASDYDKARLSCEKEWALVNILLYHEARQSAFSIARKIFKTALKFHFTEMIVQSGRLLRQYSSQIGDEKGFKTYNQYVKEYVPKQEAEIQSEELFQKVTVEYYKPIKKQAENFHEDVDSYCNQLLSLSELYNAPIINLNMFLVWSIRYELQRDYEGMLEVCVQAERYLDANPLFHSLEKSSLIQIKKMAAYLHTRAYKGGKANIEKSLQVFPAGGNYWFVFLEYYMLLALHTGNYISALAIFNQAISHPNFNKMKELDAEKWFVFEAYLQYFIEVNKLQSAISYRRRSRSFKTEQFLNAQYTYPRDQVNLTIQLVSLQILFLLERRNLRKVGDKINHLRKYALPYLKRNQDGRSLYFVRLLQQLLRTDFQIDGLVDGSRNLQRLYANPFRYKGEIAGLEVILYEDLWQRILNYLR